MGKMIRVKKKKHSQFHFAKMTVLLAFLILSFSMSYAVLTQEVIGEKTYSVQVGTFDFEIQGETNAIRLLDAYPMSDRQGQALNAYIFKLTNTGTITGSYKISLVEAEEQKQLCTDCAFLEPNKLRYSLKVNGKTLNPAPVESITVLDTGRLKPTKSNDYELRLWLNEEVGVEDEGKIYYGKILIEAVQDTNTELGEVSEVVFDEQNLGDSCKTYDDGVDTFLVGKCQNNYVWYSGKLWRVVLKNNETGAVKMITDNPMTAISYNEENQTTFENSYVDQWLSQEFLPTLHDYEDYLVVDSLWDITEDTSLEPTRPNKQTTINRTVGLLNIYEYATIYNRSDGLATFSTNYLNKGIHWWTLTPSGNSYIRSVGESGQLTTDTSLFSGSSVRPSINIKSEIQFTSGDGTLSNPYRIIGDEQETINGTTLLNTRYSGEYVRFNNELYRIVDTENNLTKIIAVDKPTELTSNRFDGASSSFASASIKKDLENYYNAIPESYKTMIEPNTVWYLGTVANGGIYKSSICTNIDANTSSKICEKTTTITNANIGLPRIGEMFTSQITRNGKSNFWTITPYNAVFVYSLSESSMLSYGLPSGEFGIRPAMYLKSNVKIANSNTGDGTYESPYDLELGE